MAAFHNPVRIRFGPGTLDELGELVGKRRCAVITTEGMARRGTLARVEGLLGSRLVGSFTEVAPNPTVASCIAAAEVLRSVEVEVLIGLGGGSAIDTAKAVAAQRAHDDAGWLARHLREGESFAGGFAPPAIIAIPTTAGTGSEVTMWGTIWDDEARTKRSISHPALFPEAAILDPELTLSVPRATTVASALDALSHAMESIWNRAANPVSDALAVRAIRLIPTTLPGVLTAPEDLQARETLLSASLLAGLAISSTRTALAHSISYPLTAELGLPHGIACSVTLPELLRAVDEHRPDRAALITDALEAPSADEAASILSALFAACGVGDTLRQHIPRVAELRGVRGGYIAPGRAENFVLDVDQAWAAALLERAYRDAA